MTAIDSTAIVQAVISHAVATGFFDRFAGHEPKSSPGSGLTGSVWVATGPDPIPGRSGLATVNAKLVLNVRLYTNMKPAAATDEVDLIDPNLIKAVDALMSAYVGAFTLDGLVEEIDVFGMAGGVSLGAKYGYIDIGGTLYRAATLTVPCIVGDVWVEVA